MTINENASRGLQADATRDCLPDRAGTPNIAQLTRSRQKVATFYISPGSGNAWCLAQLVEAGPVGITAADFPGTRIAAHVHCLRQAGVPVTTRHEANHDGWGGHHGVYQLGATVLRIEGDLP
ncbi:MAG: hypothetical protein WBB85_22325 [Albidovulum sp.]|uniref:winged helix domain-containing protein n=1 Tax=Albidovulum sp. TaxID=1872424 RepID=UPI003C86BCCE